MKAYETYLTYGLQDFYAGKQSYDSITYFLYEILRDQEKFEMPSIHTLHIEKSHIGYETSLLPAWWVLVP